MLDFKITILIICFTLFAILMFNLMSKKIGLIDLPNKRKIHEINAKLIGGLVLIFNFILLQRLLNLDYFLKNLIYFTFCIGLVGFIDDKFRLNVIGKLILIFILVFFLVNAEFNLSDIGTYETIGQINLKNFSVIFTILASLLLINGTNYIDGKDGVLITMFFLINFKLIFLINNFDNVLSHFLMYINIVLLILLFFNLTNVKNLKIFLGDSGSLSIGFFLSFILIYLAKNNLSHPILLASTITVIIFDFLSVSIERLTNKNLSIFKPDNNHIHHLIHNKTKSNIKTILAINFINTLFFIINLILFKIYNLLPLIFLIFEFFIFFIFRRLLIK